MLKSVQFSNKGYKTFESSIKIAYRCFSIGSIDHQLYAILNTVFSHQSYAKSLTFQLIGIAYKYIDSTETKK